MKIKNFLVNILYGVVLSIVPPNIKTIGKKSNDYYVKSIDLNLDGKKDLLFLCKEKNCLDNLKKINDKDIKESLDDLFKITGLHKINPFVEVYLDGDSVCEFSSPKVKGLFGLAVEPNTICIYNKDNIKKILPHEYLHLLLRIDESLEGDLEELFTYPIQYIIFENSEGRKINSLNELNKIDGLSYWAYSLFFNLNKSYGFEIGDIPRLLKEIQNEGDNGKIKCILDKQMSEISKKGSNTYKIFVEYACENPIYKINCDNINKEYCGD